MVVVVVLAGLVVVLLILLHSYYYYLVITVVMLLVVGRRGWMFSSSFTATHALLWDCVLGDFSVVLLSKPLLPDMNLF